MDKAIRFAPFLLGLGAIACAAAPGPDARSTALTPSRPPSYYVEQASRYFDTLDSGADPDSIPAYSTLVARWEWPPWLLLTGYGREMMIALDKNVVKATPATVPVRDCRFFGAEPFARCRVTFQYAEGACPIYEEFTFNDQGETTFIEAWSDLPGLLPTASAADRWAEGGAVHRLSTKIPGLGNATGTIDLQASWMQEAAKGDPEIMDFVARAEDPVGSWLQAYRDAGKDLFKRGCGW